MIGLYLKYKRPCVEFTTCILSWVKNCKITLNPLCSFCVSLFPERIKFPFSTLTFKSSGLVGYLFKFTFTVHVVLSTPQLLVVHWLQPVVAAGRQLACIFRWTWEKISFIMGSILKLACIFFSFFWFFVSDNFFWCLVTFLLRFYSANNVRECSKIRQKKS